MNMTQGVMMGSLTPLPGEPLSLPPNPSWPQCPWGAISPQGIPSTAWHPPMCASGVSVCLFPFPVACSLLPSGLAYLLPGDPAAGTPAHLQMVQVKCCWSSLVPRLICHLWGEGEGVGQCRHTAGPCTGQLRELRCFSSTE